MSEFAEADPAEQVLAVHGPGPAAAPAARVAAHPELRLLLLLLDQCFLRHRQVLGFQLSSAAWANGKPSAPSSARPSSSVFAVVTIVTSIPVTLTILS